MREPSKSPLTESNLTALFLTSDRQQRQRIRRSLFASRVYGVCSLLVLYGVLVETIDPREGTSLVGAFMLSCLCFYAVLRSGLNLRFDDPSLTLPQVLVAQTLVASSYAVAKEAHGGALMLVALVLVFGIFSMNSRRANISGAYAVLSMGAVMFYKAWTEPLVYPAKIEWGYFVLVLTIVPTITTLASLLTKMRQRFKSQKAELSQALARIHEIATHDELTGLINRRHMNQVLAEHAAMDKRNKFEFSVVLLDLDFFKCVNDTHGHRVGDEVLRNFADEARRVLRETDVIARWGGEEFLLMMPEVTPNAPAIGVDRLRFALASMQISAAVPELRITFSAGITAYRSGEPMDEAIERADHALYLAKAAGRNQAVSV
ncbi:MAG: GGDEF domain-containing protein [Rhodoferax sp.]|nr:GGDEF domain-containing protein [Rhodoferax sp.]